MFYPVSLNLRGKRVVVIGGGDVAERKVASLLGTGATMTLIAPEVTPEIESMIRAEGIEWKRRSYAAGDCEGAALVLSATDDPSVNRAVWDESQKTGALVNTADQPALCDFIMPAVLRRGELTVSVSTGGASPGLAAILRERLSEVLGPEYGQFLELLARVRPEIQQRFHDEQDRKALHYRILRSNIMELIQQGDVGAAERRLKEITS